MTGVERCFQYCDWVEQNPKLTNKYIKLSVKRFRDDLKRVEDPSCDFYFDEESANRFCAFAESMKMTKDDWSGKKITLAPWQCFFFCNLYGFKRKKESLNRFTTAFLFVGRKQGKSCLISTMGIWDILATDGAEVSIVANKREQSRRIFDDCVGFVQQNASLSKRLQIYQSTSKIINAKKRGVIEALSADKKNFDGKGCSVILADELGAMPDMSPIRILKSGSQGRKNPICVEITSGSQGTSNAGYTEWRRATKMLEGVTENDDAFFPMVFGVDENDDPMNDESCWIKAMPMLDITTSKDLIRNQIKEAKVSSEIKSEVMCKLFCRWERIANGWLSGKVIEQVVENPNRLDLTKPYVAVGGIDLSKRRDLTAWTIAFYQNERFYLKHRFYYLDEMRAEKTSNADPRWEDWTQKGWLTPTDGNVIDLDVVLEDIRKDCSDYNIREITIDPYGMYNSIIPSLQEEYDLIEVPQSTKHMSPRLKQFEEELHKGTIACDSPVFRWMLGNAVVTTDSNSNIKIWKDGGKDSQKNIDGLITSTMAVSRLLEMKNEGLLDFRSAEERQKDVEDFLKNLSL